MKTEYRIVTDKYTGYEVQFRHRVWRCWTIWRQAGLYAGVGCNTHPSIDTAKDFAKRHAMRAFAPKAKKFGAVVAQFQLYS